MLHFSCDLCGKELQAREDLRYVVKIEAFAAQDPAELTDADLDDDHLEAIGELLREMEENNEEPELPAPTKHFRYDLCGDCHKKFVRDPLSKENSKSVFFSKN